MSFNPSAIVAEVQEIADIFTEFADKITEIQDLVESQVSLITNEVFGVLQSTVDGLIDEVEGVVGDALNTVLEAFGGTTDSLGNTIDSLGNVVDSFNNIIGTIDSFGNIIGFDGEIIGTFGNIYESLQSVIPADFFNSVTDMFDNVDELREMFDLEDILSAVPGSDDYDLLTLLGVSSIVQNQTKIVEKSIAKEIQTQTGAATEPENMDRGLIPIPSPSRAERLMQEADDSDSTDDPEIEDAREVGIYDNTFNQKTITPEEARNISRTVIIDPDDVPAIVIPPPTSTKSTTPDKEYEEKLDTFIQIPGSERLSARYTLDDLIKNVTFPHKLREQHGLTKSQIIVNLKNLAINVLDKIYVMWPGEIIITNTFRPERNGSQHEFGEAVDIQFRHCKKEFYIVRAQQIRSALAGFDQILLEYKDFGSKLPWIHISYSSKKRRGLTKTYYNNKFYASGLVDPNIGIG